MSVVIAILTSVLVIVCVFLVLIILMQRASSNAGMGATLGGGAAESALGADTNNTLSRWTIYGAIIFLVFSFCLYLGTLYINHHSGTPTGQKSILDNIAQESAAGTAAGTTSSETVPVENVTPPVSGGESQEGEK